jgi:hypothetical protein
MQHWAIRIAVFVLAAAAVEIVLVGAGQEPRLIGVGVILVALAAVGSLAFDLLAAATPAAWPDNTPPESPQRALDSRTEGLVRMISREQDQHDPSRRLHALLVSLIDHRLDDRHGIDRAVDPLGASRVLGPELATLVEMSPPAAELAEPSRLAHLVTLIESI